MPRPRTPAEVAAAALAVPGATATPTSAVPSYIIQPGQTPKQVEQRRRLAENLMQEGTSSAPVQGGWIEAAARPLKAILAGGQEYGAAQEEARGKRSAAEALSQALTGEKISPQQLGEFIGNDWASPGEQAVLADVYKQQHEPVKRNLVTVDKKIYDADTGQWITPPGGAEGAAIETDDLMKFVKEYGAQPGIKSWSVVSPILQSMRKSISDPSSISDLDFVSGVAKILDPNSVVRESEGRMVIESQSITGQILGQLNKLANGEQALNEKTRRAMYNLAARRGAEAYSQAQREYEYYSQLGKPYGLRPGQLLPPGAMPEDLPAEGF